MGAVDMGVVSPGKLGQCVINCLGHEFHPCVGGGVLGLGLVGMVRPGLWGCWSEDPAVCHKASH
jgi:hypothetical protein